MGGPLPIYSTRPSCAIPAHAPLGWDDGALGAPARLLILRCLAQPGLDGRRCVPRHTALGASRPAFRRRLSMTEGGKESPPPYLSGVSAGRTGGGSGGGG